MRETPHARTTQNRRTRIRTGFTLVELLVAVLLIDVGVLALVAGTSLVARRQIEMRIRASAAQMAANRIEQLAGGPCVGSTGSGTADHGIVEQWSAELLPNGQRDVRDSVAFAIAGVARNVVIRTRVAC